MSGSFQPTMGQLMTPQMQEDIDERTNGSMQEQIQRAQRNAILAKQEYKAKERLKRSIKKRDRNRKKNKLARAARRKNR